MAVSARAHLLLCLTLLATFSGCNEANEAPELSVVFVVERNQVPQFRRELEHFAKSHSLEYTDDSEGVAERRRVVGIDDIADYEKNSLSYEEDSIVSSMIELPYTPLIQRKAHIVAHNSGLAGGLVSVYVRFDEADLSQSRLVNEFQTSISTNWVLVPNP